jgi:hypothetical protein
MSISTQITRIQNARNTIRTKLVALGLATGTAKLDECATAIDGMTDNGAIDVSVKEGESYTVPKGWHNGSGTVKGVAGGGNYALEAKEVTPTKAQQNITPSDGKYGLSSVTVQPIPDEFQDVSDVNLTEEEALAGKIFVKADGSEVAGAMTNHGAVTETIDGLSVTEYTIPKGFHNGLGKVSLTSDIETALSGI